MPRKLTYKQAGVDIDLANNLIKRLLPVFRTTARPGVVGKIGGFSGLFEAPTKGFKRPLLVAGTDGVGTKLLVAQAAGRHDTIGIDLVAMSVNDIVCAGAEPLFFLDYFATGGLQPEVYVDVLKGIVKGCRQANCALLGGETAEMPGLYKKGDYDLAGFAVGVVDADAVIDGSKIRPGDAVIGMPSTGLHSNGYSLARKVFKKTELAGEWGRKLLAPTKIYVPAILALRQKVDVLGLAHITGGGFYDNIPRCLPDGVGIRIDRRSWKVPPLFREIQRRGNIDEAEMFRTLNMGIGMVAVVRASAEAEAVASLKASGVRARKIGEVTAGNGEVEIV
jgi:phosphoribosylformylglycinamidine cyclo-ligase